MDASQLPSFDKLNNVLPDIKRVHLASQERLDVKLAQSEATAQGLKAACDAATATMETQLLKAGQSKHKAVKHAKEVCIQSQVTDALHATVHMALCKEYLVKATEADKCFEKEVQQAEAAYASIVLAEQNKLEQARQALKAGELDVCKRRTELERVYNSQQEVVCQLTRLLSSADQVSSLAQQTHEVAPQGLALPQTALQCNQDVVAVEDESEESIVSDDADNSTDDSSDDSEVSDASEQGEAALPDTGTRSADVAVTPERVRPSKKRCQSGSGNQDHMMADMEEDREESDGAEESEQAEESSDGLSEVMDEFEEESESEEESEPAEESESEAESDYEVEVEEEEWEALPDTSVSIAVHTLPDEGSVKAKATRKRCQPKLHPSRVKRLMLTHPTA